MSDDWLIVRPAVPADADALQGLFEKTEHPFLLHLLRHRDVARLRQTVEGLLKTVMPDGRIHTTFNQLIAATGRLSSTDPNLQNIPIRTEAGRELAVMYMNELFPVTVSVAGSTPIFDPDNERVKAASPVPA